MASGMSNWGWRRWAGAVAITAGVLAAVVCLRSQRPQEPAQAQVPRSAPKQAQAPPTPAAPKPTRVPKRLDPRRLKIVAIVNGQRITREQLAQECMLRYGPDVLDSLINKELILQYCERRGIKITQEEVQAEIARMARRFHMRPQEWLRLLEQERGITPQQYANDIIWPTLALRRVAAKLLEVTPEEIQAAYETQYGPAVEVRMILCRTREQAEKVLRLAKARPEEFEKLARTYSTDPVSAGYGGRIPPVRKHLGDPRLERAAFALQEGQISNVVPIDGGFVILKCVRHIPDRMKEFPLEKVRKQLEQMVRDKKEPLVARQVFQKLRKAARVLVIYGYPEREKQYPGLAALVNHRQITREQLALACLERHGTEVLDGMINRLILFQEIKKEGILITDQDIRQEVQRAAEAMGVVDAQGRPDLQRWYAMIQEQQGLDRQRYLREIVWPTVALKKLVLRRRPEQVKVTPEDLRKAFEANYGPRVKCRAIVLNNPRTAQIVWEKARANPDPIYFGQLSSKYSVDANLRVLNGEIPPIQRHSGRPVLEREAFALKKGEVSGIIQLKDKYVILFCEGYTQPQKVTLEEVRDILEEDIYEKKLRRAMAAEFASLLDQARVENFLANTRHVPVRQARTPVPSSR